MKITEDVRKYAAEQGIAEEEGLKKGMEEKSREFTEKGSEIYSKREAEMLTDFSKHSATTQPSSADRNPMALSTEKTR